MCIRDSAQGIGVVGQGGDIDRLQIGRLDGCVELGRILIFSGEPVGDGAAHRFFPDGNGGPFFAIAAVNPFSGTKKGIGLSLIHI